METRRSIDHRNDALLDDGARERFHLPELQSSLRGAITPAALVEAEYISMQGAGLDWLVHRRLCAFARRVVFPRLDEIERWRGARVVKENTHRKVIRVRSDAGELFVKRFRLKTWVNELKALVLPSKAMVEWSHGRRLYDAKVPTAQPAFVGERRDAGRLRDAVVAFFRVPASRDYAEVLKEVRKLPPTESNARRRVLIDNLARLTHQLFERGALHGDYHLGNVLANPQDELSIIDLSAVRFVPRPFPEQRLHILSRMALSHAPFAREARRWARDEVFWLCEAYAELDRAHGDARELHRAVLERAWDLEQVRLRSRDKRCLVRSSLYVPKRSLRRAVFRRREVPADDLALAARAPAQALLHENARGRVEVIPAPPSLAQAIAALRGGEPPATLVRKTAFASKPSSLLGTAWTGSKGYLSWRAARAMEVRGLPTALHLGLMEERQWGLVCPQSVVIMEHLEGCKMLHHALVEDLGPDPGLGGPGYERRRSLIRELAELLARVQEVGICHHDLAVQNVLVRDAEAGFELFLVDLDAVRMRRLRRRDRMRNLVQFADLPEEASIRDRLRFLQDYLELGGREIVEPELREWGLRGLKREVSARLSAKMAAKAERMRGRSAEEP